MTIKSLTFIAIAATMFTACAESTTTPPSKAQECAAGLTAQCIMGTWSTEGPTIPQPTGEGFIYIIDPSHNFREDPATLKFYVDEKKVNKFEFTNSSKSTAFECKPTKIYGNWEIINNSIHLNATAGNDCIDRSQNDKTIQAEINIDGNDVALTIKELYFLEPEMKSADAVTKAGSYEVYNFVSSN